MVPSPACNYPQFKDFLIYLQRQKLLQFLMGLNEFYSQARSKILLINPLPIANQNYSMVISDAGQKIKSQSINNVRLVGIAPDTIESGI